MNFSSAACLGNYRGALISRRHAPEKLRARPFRPEILPRGKVKKRPARG